MDARFFNEQERKKFKVADAKEWLSFIDTGAVTIIPPNIAKTKDANICFRKAVKPRVRRFFCQKATKSTRVGIKTGGKTHARRNRGGITQKRGTTTGHARHEGQWHATCTKPQIRATCATKRARPSRTASHARHKTASGKKKACAPAKK